MATHAKDPRPQDRDGVPDPSSKTGKRSSLGFLRENLGCLRGKTSESLTIGRCACIQFIIRNLNERPLNQASEILTFSHQLSITPSRKVCTLRFLYGMTYILLHHVGIRRAQVLVSIKPLTAKTMKNRSSKTILVFFALG